MDLSDRDKCPRWTGSVARLQGQVLAPFFSDESCEGPGKMLYRSWKNSLRQRAGRFGER